MALANVSTSTGTRTYSGITMRYTMSINSITQNSSDSSKMDINYTLVSKRESGSSHPYASIQAIINEDTVYNSGYTAYNEWPGKEGTKSYTAEKKAGWGSNLTFRVEGHIGSSTGNTLTGNTVTVRYNTLSYTSDEGTVPSNYSNYTGYSVTVGELTGLSSAYQFDYWEDNNGNQYDPGDTITFNQADIELTAHLTLLNPKIESYSIVSRTETSITYGPIIAKPIESNLYYRVNEGIWIAANAAGGTISDLTAGTSYTISFKATYLDRPDDIVSTTTSTYAYPRINYFSGATPIQGGRQYIAYLDNPRNYPLQIVVQINGTTIKTIPSSSGYTYAAQNFIITNAEAGPYINPNSKNGTISFKIKKYQNSNILRTQSFSFVLTGSGPAVDTSKINNFIGVTQTDSSAVVSGGSADTTHLIQGKSKATITLNSSNNPFTALYGASLSNYKIAINEIDKGAITIGTGKTINETIPINDEYKITITATDTRGFSNTCEKTLTTVRYTVPSISLLSVDRVGGFGTTATFSSTGSFSSNITGINGGAAYFKIYTTGISGSPFNIGTSTLIKSGATIVNGNNQPISFNVNNSYPIYLEVKDKYGATVTSNILTLPIGEPTAFIDVEQNGVGVNCFPNGEGLWVKTNAYVGDADDTTSEHKISCKSGAGELYLYSQGTSSGNRGLYTPAHGTGSAKSIVTVDTNNNVTFNGSATNATKLGTASLGNSSVPIYLNNGSPEQCNFPISGNWFRGIPSVSSGGVTELGRYIDFHPTNASTLDYSKRIDAGAGTTTRILTLPDQTGTLACVNDIDPKIDTKLDAAFPVGSVYITSTNNNPGAYLPGGTASWQLIDKGLKSQYIYSTDTTYFTRTNVDSNRIRLDIGDHTISINADMNNSVKYDDTEVKIGTFKLSDFTTAFSSASSPGAHARYVTGYSDAGNSGLLLQLSSTGVLSCVDVIGDDYISKDKGINFNFEITVPYDSLVDSACDKFYWKRIEPPTSI